jgi:ABC-type glycerol-3-phosphate transport system permease component
LLVTLFPFYWLFVLATRDAVDALGSPELFFVPDFSAFTEVWLDRDFSRSLSMSATVTVLTVLLSLAVGVPAAYALSRRQVRRRTGLIAWLLVAYLLPDFLIAIPMFAVFQSIGLYDTALGLAIAYQVFMAPLTMWLLLRFFGEVPSELAEAALIDGCTERSVLSRVYLPIVMPGVATTAIIVGMLAWNEVTIALALTMRNPTLPITVASYKGYASIEWDQLAAASLMVTVPLFLFALFAQKRIVGGLTAGIGK